MAVARYNATAERCETMNVKTKNANGDKVRCTFDLTKAEAAKLCDMRCEPKPSTAAAQIVRMAIKNKKGGAK